MRVICCLAAVVIALGVRVASAGPNGIVLESYVGERSKDADKVLSPLIQEMRRRKYTMGVALTPTDAAKTILFLSCDDSSGITGTTLVIDAGYLTAAEWDTRGRTAFMTGGKSGRIKR